MNAMIIIVAFMVVASSVQRENNAVLFTARFSGYVWIRFYVDCSLLTSPSVYLYRRSSIIVIFFVSAFALYACWLESAYIYSHESEESIRLLWSSGYTEFSSGSPSVLWVRWARCKIAYILTFALLRIARTAWADRRSLSESVGGVFSVTKRG